MDTSFGQDLKCLALNCKEPFIIKDILDWDILEWNLEQWSQVLNSEEMEFRCGKYKHTTVGETLSSFMSSHMYYRIHNGKGLLK